MANSQKNDGREQNSAGNGGKPSPGVQWPKRRKHSREISPEKIRMDAKNIRIINTFPQEDVGTAERELIKMKQAGYRNAHIYEAPKRPFPEFQEPEFYGLPKAEKE